MKRQLVALEERFTRRKAPLLKALEEYQKVLAHLENLRAEGRYPEGALRAALAREELRIAYVKGELARLEEAHRLQVAKRLTRARVKAARLAALAQAEEALDDLFPLPQKEEGHAPAL
ncbi:MULTISPECIES: hypothetical protein [Thermus]|uniref:hypothetical protein n=1 Tax=Thermus TaxID=270 RepID=UPI001F1C2DA2|nr:hypothetical protein [Thermus brockianus]